MIELGRALGRLLFLPALVASVIFPSHCQAALVGPGDIAFIRFDGETASPTFDDFAIVLLTDADAGQLVGFNTNEYDANQGKFTRTVSDHFVWEVDEALTAGTVVTFSNLDRSSNPIASEGIIQNAFPRMMKLLPNGQTIYAYLGTDVESPETFLAGISTESTSVFDGTGLVVGQTAVYLPLVSGDEVDEAHYVGPRSIEGAFPDYLPAIGDVNANWVRRNSSGTLTPFDSSNFTLQNGASVPESPAVVALGVLMLLACLSLAARVRREPAMALAE